MSFISMSILIVSLLIMGLIYWRAVNLKRRQLNARINRYLSPAVEGFEEKFGEAADELRASDIRKELESFAFEYCEDLPNMKNGLVYLSRNHVFSAPEFSAVIQDRFAAEFFKGTSNLKWWLNAFIVLGILGTFIGFTIFLFSISGSFADIASDDGIGNIFSGLYTAFITSISGILVMILGYRSYFAKESQIQKLYDDMIGIVELHILPKITVERTEGALQYVADSVRGSMEDFKEAMDSLRDDASILHKAAESIQQGNEGMERLSERFSQAIDGQQRQLAQMEEAISQVGEQREQDQRILNEIVELHRQNAESISAFRKTVEPFGEGMGRLSSLYEQIMARIDAEDKSSFLEDFQSNLSLFLSQFQEKYESTVKQVTENWKEMEKYLVALDSRFAELVGSAQNELSNDTKELKDFLEKVGNTFKEAINSGNADIQSVLAEDRENREKERKLFQEHLKKNADHVQGAGEGLKETVDEINATLQTFSSSISGQTAAEGNLAEKLVDFSERFEKTAADLEKILKKMKGTSPGGTAQPQSAAHQQTGGTEQTEVKTRNSRKGFFGRLFK